MNIPSTRNFETSWKSFTMYTPTPIAPTTGASDSSSFDMREGQLTKLEHRQNPYNHKRPVAPHKDSNPTGKEALH